ncbi:MAG: IS1182 family transposase, partial [Terriglobales bacterium]
EGHLARFLADVVAQLDLRAMYATYEEKDGRGQAAYAPAMMLRLLLYGYCMGTSSSRQIETKTYEDVAFRYLAGDEHPDHSTISEFRKGQLKTVGEQFVQVLRLCQEAGLVKLGHVALDGSKLQANASKHKAMSYERMKASEEQLQAEVAALLQRAEAVDAAEDEKFGKGRRGDELPAELARRESRLEKIRTAKAALEAEAKQKAEAEKAAAEAKMAERRQQEASTGKKVAGREPQLPDPEAAVPAAGAQRNFTDPDSRIMPDGSHQGSFVQGYNAQVVVDAEAQVIVAAAVSQASNDAQQLAPMLAQVEQNAGAKPKAASADAGYWNAAQVEDERVQGIDLYVATGRQRHGVARESVADEAPPGHGPMSSRERMQHKLKTAAGQNVYRMRKAIVEPVFGQIKERRRFRRFSCAA